jgi:hypothetical protein
MFTFSDAASNVLGTMVWGRTTRWLGLGRAEVTTAADRRYRISVVPFARLIEAETDKVIVGPAKKAVLADGRQVRVRRPWFQPLEDRCDLVDQSGRPVISVRWARTPSWMDPTGRQPNPCGWSFGRWGDAWLEPGLRPACDLVPLVAYCLLLLHRAETHVGGG